MLSINGYVPSENEVIFERFISTNFQNSNRFLLYVPLSLSLCHTGNEGCKDKSYWLP